MGAKQAITQFLPLYHQIGAQPPKKKSKKSNNSSNSMAGVINRTGMMPMVPGEVQGGIAGMMAAPAGMPAGMPPSGLNEAFAAMGASVPIDQITHPAQVEALLKAKVAVEFKAQLNHICQKVKGGQIRSGEIAFHTQKFSNNPPQVQCTVKLLCLENHGQPEFAGNVATNPKDAEKDAALQAIKHFLPIYETIPASLPQGKGFGKGFGKGYGKGFGKDKGFGKGKFYGF